jgi:nucleotide-binding universal stress UspA family protein
VTIPYTESVEAIWKETAMKVIIGIDDLASVNEITNFVLQHKWGKDAEFKLIFSVAPVMMDHPMAAYPLFLESAVRDAEDAGRKLLADATAKIRNGLKVEVEGDVVIGLPVPSLVQAAKDWKADMIVTGSHGRHGLDRFFFGSVSYDVAAHAPCSVMVVRLEGTKPQQTKPAMATATKS